MPVVPWTAFVSTTKSTRDFDGFWFIGNTFKILIKNNDTA